MTDALAIPDISVVIPCYNEEENAAAIAEAVIATLEPTGASFDLIFIDNKSTDQTVPIIKEICARDPRVRLIANARNFGQMRSPTHGIYAARGRAVIGMCADFQDPPELLAEFVRRWRRGASIVLGVRRREQSSRSLQLFRILSYQIVRQLNDVELIPNATGFGLYDRKVVDTLKHLNEPEPFFRAMLVESGYPIELITYDRPARSAGKSKNNFFTLLDFAMSALATSSRKLLGLPLFLGILIAMFSAVLFLVWGVYALLYGPNWTCLALAFAQLQISIIFIFIGVVSNLLGTISDRTRNVALVNELERVNFPPGY
ncbi:glycosyltransferase family 2 protein [Sandarakinorhabdus sp.]|uniref:glycosyltransferase family 2 protein n=1 Tax=Sandarakinorhabdus sp. TaxID=1916663 RepID=UPI003569BE68